VRLISVLGASTADALAILIDRFARMAETLVGPRRRACQRQQADHFSPRKNVRQTIG
jgi:hypothetical protein